MTREWSTIKKEIGRIGVESKLGFLASAYYWKTGEISFGEQAIVINGDLNEEIDVKGCATLIIEGNCYSRVRITENAMVHISGSLYGQLDLGEASDVVIGGAVQSEGSLKSNSGFSQVFVGEMMCGNVLLSGNSNIFVQGDLSGIVKTLGSTALIIIKGDCRGEISTEHVGSTLFLSVGGIMQLDELKNISQSGFRMCHAYLEQCEVSSSSENAKSFLFLSEKDTLA